MARMVPIFYIKLYRRKRKSRLGWYLAGAGRTPNGIIRRAHEVMIDSLSILLLGIHDVHAIAGLHRLDFGA